MVFPYVFFTGLVIAVWRLIVTDTNVCVTLSHQVCHLMTSSSSLKTSNWFTFFSLFQQWQQNKGKFTAPISALFYPTSPPLQHRAPIHLPIITCQGKRRAIPRRRAPLEDVPIDLVSVDLVSVVVIFFIDAPPPPPLSHIDYIPTDGSSPPLFLLVAVVVSQFSPHLSPLAVFVFVFVVVIYSGDSPVVLSESLQWQYYVDTSD